MCSKYLNNKSFVFTGFIDDHRKLEEMLAGAWVGVAPYRDDVSSFSRYADPGKVKAYLCLGLPVVMTSVPPIAKAIGAQECGIVTAADARDLADAIILLLRKRMFVPRWSVGRSSSGRHSRGPGFLRRHSTRPSRLNPLDL